jgi:hypothetical protein
MASDASEQPSLLDLPDACLLAVLQCCAADSQRSLFSAARAHGRLQQAAVLVLHSITADITQQQQAESVLLYLGKHGTKLDCITLRAAPAAQRRSQGFGAVCLRELPPNLQPDSVMFSNHFLQLQPGWGFQGVLGCRPSSGSSLSSAVLLMVGALKA